MEEYVKKSNYPNVWDAVDSLASITAKADLFR